MSVLMTAFKKRRIKMCEYKTTANISTLTNAMSESIERKQPKSNYVLLRMPPHRSGQQLTLHNQIKAITRQKSLAQRVHLASYTISTPLNGARVENTLPSPWYSICLLFVYSARSRETLHMGRIDLLDPGLRFQKY